MLITNSVFYPGAKMILEFPCPRLLSSLLDPAFQHFQVHQFLFPCIETRENQHGIETTQILDFLVAPVSSDYKDPKKLIL